MKQYCSRILFIIIVFITASVSLQAQCPYDPTVSGDSLLCPGAGGVISTDVYDSYQWYKRGFSEATSSLIPGATSRTLQVDAFNDAPSYFSVEVRLSGCTERSPEKLIDGLAFLPPVVQSTGDYDAGNNGEFVICEGDTMYYQLMAPYDTSIVWFNNGVVIPGATSPILIITEEGRYTTQGAPKRCPSYVQSLGVTLEVKVIDCSTDLEKPGYSNINLYPNPAKGIINLELDKAYSEITIKILDYTGKIVQSNKYSDTRLIKESIRKLGHGVYFVTVSMDGITTFERVVKN